MYIHACRTVCTRCTIFKKNTLNRPYLYKSYKLDRFSW